MKRLNLFLIALAAFVSVVAANPTVVIDGITYQQLNDTEAELINGEQYSSAELVIPAQVQIGGKQLNVVSIGPKAFYGNSVKRVEMPNTVKSIGVQAFYFCENLRQVTFSNSLKQIGNHAFYYCHDIKKLELPATLTSVGEGAFYYCHNVDSLFIPRNLVNIGVAAFARCGSQSIVVAPENTKYDSRGNCNAIIETATGLLLSGCQNTEIPDGVKTIEELAFLMANFQSIVLPNSLTEIRKNAFQSCVNLKEIELPNALVNLGNSAFYHCDHLSKIKMGNSLKTIGSSTFAECGSINELTLSNSLQTIGDNAFFNTRIEIEELILPESLLAIGYAAFCREVSFFETPPPLRKVHIGNNVTTIGGWAFSGYENLTEVDLGNSLTHLGENVFAGSHIESIVLPASYTIIEPRVFSSMGLKNVTLQGAVTSIGDAAFDNNPDLKVFVFPESLQSIGEFAFSYCGLENVVIPNRVTSIGEEAFSYCRNLTGVTIGSSLATLGFHAFSGCENLRTVNWNAESCADLEYDFLPWPYDGITTFNIGDEVKRVPAYLCALMDALTSITIPQSVNSIGTGALMGCSGLESMVVVNDNPKYDSRGNCNAIIETASNTLIYGCKNTIIPGTVISIGAGAFLRCTGLTSIIIPNSVKTVGARAFEGCTGLRSVEIGNSVTSIDYRTFADCTGLSSLNMGNSVTSIEREAFTGCTSLASIVIHDKVKSVGDNAFAGCTGAASVEIGNSVTSIGGGAFSDCTGLTNVTIGSSVTSFGSNAFARCTGLETVNWNAKSCADFTSDNRPFKDVNTITTFNFGNQVKHVPSYLCFYMSGITSLNFSKSVTSIGDLAFGNCTGLIGVTLPNSLATIGGMAFGGCSNLADITIPGSVTSIGMSLLYNCNSLMNIDCYINHPNDVELGFLAFQGVKVAECTLHVLKGRYDEYRNAEQWKDFVNIVDDLEALLVPGDVNGDGRVNVSDVTALINMILGITDKDETVADVNHDGKINVSDVTALINIILGIH